MLRYFTAGSPYSINVARLTFNQGLGLALIAGTIIYLMIAFPVGKRSDISMLEYSMLFICLALFNPNAWLSNFVFCLFAYMTLTYYLCKTNFRDKTTLILLCCSFFLMTGAGESIVGNDLEDLLEKLSSVTIGTFILLFLLFRLKFRKMLS